MRVGPSKIPTALTIAGSDSGGGAGIQADLKTFEALGVHGLTAITCLTAQNPIRVTAIEPCSERMLRQQLEAVFEAFEPAAAKTGMLYSAGLVRAVVNVLKHHRRVPLIVDPVMVSTSGRQLLDQSGIEALKRHLLPRATLVTPNVPEAELLLGVRIKTPEDLRLAGRALHEQFGCAALVKGGHLRGLQEAIDIFYDGKLQLLLSAPFIRGIKTHGTGCSYSAAITAYLARGYSLVKAVQAAKQFITKTIAGSHSANGHWVLGWAAPERSA